MSAKAEIGTIIQGTLNTEELVQAFVEELERLGSEDAVIDDAKNWLDMDEDQGERGEAWEEEGSELVSSLIDSLNEFSPQFCYFGASEGDGADFGFWLDDGAIRDSQYDGELLACSDEKFGTPIPTYTLHTSDHGNQTLYQVKLEEIW